MEWMFVSFLFVGGFSSHIEIFSIKWYGDVTIPLWKALNFGLCSTLIAIKHGLLPHARQTLLTSSPPSRLEWMNSNEWTPRKKKNDFSKVLFCCSEQLQHFIVLVVSSWPRILWIAMCFPTSTNIILWRRLWRLCDINHSNLLENNYCATIRICILLQNFRPCCHYLHPMYWSKRHWIPPNYHLNKENVRFFVIWSRIKCRCSSSRKKNRK